MKSYVSVPTASLAAMLIAGTLWGGVVYGQTTATGDLPAMVVGAKTAADHEAIAKRYEELAGKERTEASEHQKLAASYREMTSSVVGKHHLNSLAKHCDNLAKNANASASDYDALAAGQRQLAKGVQ